MPSTVSLIQLHLRLLRALKKEICKAEGKKEEAKSGARVSTAEGEVSEKKRRREEEKKALRASTFGPLTLTLFSLEDVYERRDNPNAKPPPFFQHSAL